MIRIFIVVLALAFPSGASAQWTAEQQMLNLFEMIPEDLESLDPEDNSYQNPVQILNWVGREDIAEAMLENAPSFVSRQICPEIGSLDSLWDQVVEEARDTQIVMINESHFDPRHRWIAGFLATRLSDIGYEYFAAETFNSLVFEERDGGSVPFNAGAYSYEPIFARFLGWVDQAEMGWVAYEQRPDQQPENPETWEARINARESAQAENLVAALFKQNPDARVLIYVGGIHLYEQPVVRPEREEVRWFGNRLAEATGINPVTISQTTCDSESGTFAADGSETRASGSIDHFIAHPPLEFDRHRPTWRREIGDIDTEIPTALLSDNERIIIEAHPAGGDISEVAIDRLMIFPGEDIPLLLPPGRYDLRSYTSEGLLAGPLEVIVSE